MPEQSKSEKSRKAKITSRKKDGDLDDDSGFVFCPACGSEVRLIWVHGHYQCPVCKNIVTSCCDGEN